MKARILLVEDDQPLARVLKRNLAYEGFEVECAEDGRSAVAKTRSFVPDLVVLDVMLPDVSGFDLFGALHQKGRPIIIVTARAQREDKLRGLGLGADDYIAKPFDLEEFLARVHNVLRRACPPTATLQLGNVTVDFGTRTARCGQSDLHLTQQEFEILRYLAERQHRIVYRHELLSHVWEYPDTPVTRSVDQAIARLRKKIEPQPHNPRYIHTVHGEGYRLTTEPLSTRLAYGSS